MDDRGAAHAHAPEVPRLEFAPDLPRRAARRRRRPARPASDLRAVFLTNMVPPYRLPELEALDRKVGELQVWVSTTMEPNRHWQPDWGTLKVVPQRNLTLRRDRRHPGGYDEQQIMHVPWDTLPRLWRTRPDVVLSADLGARTLQASLYCRLTSTPLVVLCGMSESTERGRGRTRRVLRRFLVPRADALTVTGSSGARYLQRLGGDPGRMVFLPYSSFQPDRGELPPRPSGGPLRLLVAGQLIERKGVLPLVKALARWGRRHPGRPVELHLVGSGPLAARIDAVELPADVTLRRSGNVAYEELPELYAGADVSVLPSLGDEWGNSVNESLALGVPVIGSLRSQAVEMLVRDGVNGWLFQPDEPASLDAALDRALAVTWPELERMRAAARESVRFLTPEFTGGQLLAAALLASQG